VTTSLQTYYEDQTLIGEVLDVYISNIHVQHSHHERNKMDDITFCLY